jgi:hypothetical protein
MFEFSLGRIAPFETCSLPTLTHVLPPFETRSLPSLLAATHRGFTLITRTTRARASYPSCVAVYSRD